MKTNDMIRTVEEWAALLATAGPLNSVNAAAVGSFKGLVRSAVSDAEIVAELRRLADAHDVLMRQV